jgi:outer membrane protein assembly factor BamB
VAVPEPAVGPRRRVPVWFIVLAAVTAVLALVTFAVALGLPDRLRNGPDRPLAFGPLGDPIATIGYGERLEVGFAQVIGERAFIGGQVGEDLILKSIDVATGVERWSRTVTGAPLWTGLLAVPDAVVVYGHDYAGEDPRPMVVHDPETGQERWRRDYSGADETYVMDGVLVHVDWINSRIRGLRLADGDEVWEREFPVDRSGTPGVTVLPVYARADLAGASTFFGGTAGALADDRMVLVGADRSVTVVDVGSGEVLAERANVAGLTDFLLAYEDRLYVAPDRPGYAVVGYDLTRLDAEPRTIYQTRDPERRPSRLRACGVDRVCLLDSVSYDRETTQVAVVDAATATEVWRHDAAGVDRLVPVGEAIMVGDTYPYTVGYTGAGERFFEQRQGVAVRINGGNMLLFATLPASYAVDLSVAGVAVGTGDLTELGLLPEVRGEGCSWGGVYLVCPGEDNFRVWRYATP